MFDLSIIWHFFVSVGSICILDLLLLLLLLLISFYTIIYNNENASYAPSTYILTESLNSSSFRK